MASTYSPGLGIELPGTGDQAGVWGNTTNTNLGTLIEQAISGYVTQAVATGTDTTITIPNGATGVARNMYLELTGSGGASTNLIVPANKKLYFIFNNTSSGQVTVKVSGQTGISVPNGKKMILVSNGTDIVTAENYVASLSTDNISYTGTLTGGTGVINIGSGQFYKDAGGFVGIGTATPNARLEVKQVSTITNLSNSYTNSALNIQYTPSVVLAVGTDGTNSLIQAVNSSTNTANSLSIQPFGGNVGIGVTTTPAYKLEVAQSGAGDIAYFRMSNAVALAPALAIEFPSNTPNVATKLQGIRTGSGRDGNIAINADGGNVGIGTASPSYKLHVVGGAAIANRTTSDTLGNISLGVLSTSSVATFGWRTDTSNNLHFDIYNGASWSAALTTSLAGNLGLGVTPSAWGSGAKSLEGVGGALTFFDSTNDQIWLTQNAYWDGSWKYKTTNYASSFQQYLGSHVWFTAPSWNGTGSDVISFTQAMTLDASGNLGVGTTSPSTFGKTAIVAANGAVAFYAGTGAQGVFVSADNTTRLVTYNASGNFSGGHLWQIGNTNSMILDTSGNFGVGTTSPSPYTGSSRVIHVDGGANAAEIKLTNNASGASGVTGLLLTLSGTAGYLWNVENDFLSFGTNNTERARITSSGDMNFTTNGARIGNRTISGGDFKVVSDYDPTSTLSLEGASHIKFSTYDSSWKERGRFTSGGNFQLTSGGQIELNVSTLSSKGAIAAFNVDSTSGGLVFKTESSGTLSERARFNSTGAFVFAGGTTTADGIGITFPATQSASSNANTLDDYEEGTWTPTLTAATTAPTGVSYSFRGGWYRKVGSMVVAGFGISLSNKGTGGVGVIRITGLPFTGENYGSYREPTVAVNSGNWNTADVAGKSYLYNASSTTYLEGRYQNNADTQIPYSDVSDTTYINCTITYYV